MIMNKDEFIKLVSEYQQWNSRIDEVGNVLNCELFEADWIEYAHSLFDFVLKKVFDSDGVDIVYWWLFEKSYDNDLNMFDADHSEIPTETIDDIWMIVKDHVRNGGED